MIALFCSLPPIYMMHQRYEKRLLFPGLKNRKCVTFPSKPEPTFTAITTQIGHQWGREMSKMEEILTNNAVLILLTTPSIFSIITHQPLLKQIT
jgi:hypothetical protein